MRTLRFLLLCLLPLTALASTKLTVGDVVVTGQPVFDHNVYHGYAEYRFQVANHSDRERLVEVQLTSTHGSRFTMNKKVVAPAGSRLEFSMFANRRKSQHNMRVIVDNREEKTKFLSESYSGFAGHDEKASLLVSKSMNQDDLQSQLEGLHGWTGKNDFNKNYALRRTDLATAEWSENWLAYSSFDGVILRADEFADLTPKARAALRQYVEAGGVLSIVGDLEFPFAGATARTLNANNSNRREYAVGFGLCFIYPSDTPPDFVWLKKEKQAWLDAQIAFYYLDEPASATNDKLPVVDQLSIPTRGFLLLVTVFALIAGPATVITLAKTNRRIWLLWIIPLESAVACGIVLAYSFASEGITPTVRTRAITLLDQERHAAITLGWLGYYCPQRPSEGLFFPEDLEINPVEQFSWNSTPRSIDWSRGQHLKKGWLEARAPAFFMTRRHAIRRERLEFSINEKGQVEVVNGLGAEIEELWYRDFEGNYHHTKKLNAGQKGALDPDTEPAKKDRRRRELFTHNHGENEFEGKTPHASYLRPGTYVAILNGAPFMDHGLGERKLHLTTESLVYGVLPKEEQP